jgi:hypothetical protein
MNAFLSGWEIDLFAVLSEAAKIAQDRATCLMCNVSNREETTHLVCAGNACSVTLRRLFLAFAPVSVILLVPGVVPVASGLRPAFIPSVGGLRVPDARGRYGNRLVWSPVVKGLRPERRDVH